ncbi:MAG: glycosyltransferase family 2 protein [Clostridia bacterium]|nr:glycosyltransferase family 2 protein [Clostridia bacterium]
MELISVIIPCYNEEGSAPLFYERAAKLADGSEDVRYEFIFVDDGSTDRTAEILRELSRKDERVRYISFSRNFGKEAAMYAGFRAARGDYAVSADADLQHPPELIGEMYRAIKEEGWDCVAARRTDRSGEPVLKRFFSAAFYKIINSVSETKLVSGACDFRLMSRKMLDAVLELSERNRFSKGIFDWVGFRTKWISFENVKRAAGTSKWSFRKLLSYSMEGILSFSTALLAVPLFAGALMLAAWLALLVVYLCGGAPDSSAWLAALLVGGINLVCIGIVGAYVSKGYREIKSRPLYIVRETDEDLKKEDGNR